MFNQKPIFNKSSLHFCSSLNLNKAFIYMTILLLPLVLFGSYNIGFNAFKLAGSNLDLLEGFRLQLVMFLGLTISEHSIVACFLYGFLWFLPLFLISLAVAKVVEIGFAKFRKKTIEGGIFLTALLYTLTLPPSIPLWLAGVGVFFGIFFAREVFGGLGKNFMNPILAGRAFIFFAYPVYMSGNAVWTVVDGHSGATALSIANDGGLEALLSSGLSWDSAFVGRMVGSIGETSALLCLLGAIALIMLRLVSWQIMAGIVAGVIFISGIFNTVGSETNAMFHLPWYWHFVIGGLAFGAVFLATEPSSAPQTNAGRWIYGFLIGAMTILIRVANPSFPEGIMLAILLGNVFAPLIDYFVIKAHIAKRLKKYES